MLFKNKKSPGRIENIKIDQTNIPLVHETKFLGIWLDEGLTWVAHLNKLNIKLKRDFFKFTYFRTTVICWTATPSNLST